MWQPERRPVLQQPFNEWLRQYTISNAITCFPPLTQRINRLVAFYLILKSVIGQREKQHKHAVLISTGVQNMPGYISLTSRKFQMNTIEIKVSVDTGPIDSFILGGAVRASNIETSLASIKELQDNVAAIITNATDTRHQLERIDHQRNEDFVSLSKAVRSVEESISQLSHRDSFIR